jgi:hypothetical protein
LRNRIIFSKYKLPDHPFLKGVIRHCFLWVTSTLGKRANEDGASERRGEEEPGAVRADGRHEPGAREEERRGRGRGGRESDAERDIGQGTEVPGLGVGRTVPAVGLAGVGQDRGLVGALAQGAEDAEPDQTEGSDAPARDMQRPVGAAAGGSGGRKDRRVRNRRTHDRGRDRRLSHHDARVENRHDGHRGRRRGRGAAVQLPLLLLELGTGGAGTPGHQALEHRAPLGTRGVSLEAERHDDATTDLRNERTGRGERIRRDDRKRLPEEGGGNLRVSAAECIGRVRERQLVPRGRGASPRRSVRRRQRPAERRDARRVGHGRRLPEGNGRHEHERDDTRDERDATIDTHDEEPPG